MFLSEINDIFYSQHKYVASEAFWEQTWNKKKTYKEK